MICLVDTTQRGFMCEIDLGLRIFIPDTIHVEEYLHIFDGYNDQLLLTIFYTGLNEHYW